MKRRSVRELLDHHDWAELAAQVSYNAKALAALCQVSVRTLEREFQEYFQTSPQRWLDWFRALKGRELKEAGERTKEVANLLGYKDPSHLCHKLNALCESAVRRVAESDHSSD